MEVCVLTFYDSTYLNNQELPLPNTISTVQGRKSEGDRIVKIHGHAVTFYDLLHAIHELFKSEDSNYPPPFLRGGDYILDMFQELRKTGKVTKELCKKYKVPIKESK